jgi:hypothetical protein
MLYQPDRAKRHDVSIGMQTRLVSIAYRLHRFQLPEPSGSGENGPCIARLISSIEKETPWLAISDSPSPRFGFDVCRLADQRKQQGQAALMG